MHKQRIMVIAVFIIGFIGCTMPWLSYDASPILGAPKASLYLNAFSSGIYGWLTFFGLVAAYTILSKDKNSLLPIDKLTKTVVLGGGLFAAFFSVLGMLLVDDSTGLGAVTTMGSGPFVTLLSGVLLVSVPFIISDSGDFEMPTKETIKEDLIDIKEDISEIKDDLTNNDGEELKESEEIKS